MELRPFNMRAQMSFKTAQTCVLDDESARAGELRKCHHILFKSHSEMVLHLVHKAAVAGIDCPCRVDRFQLSSVV